MFEVGATQSPLDLRNYLFNVTSLVLVTSLWGRQSPSVFQNGTATPGMLPSTLYGDLGSAAASRTQTPDHSELLSLLLRMCSCG